MFTLLAPAIAAMLIHFVTADLGEPIDDDANQSAPVQKDCGLNALYILLKLTHREIPLRELHSILPERHEEGYSMAELISAAKHSGLPLKGRVITHADLPLKEPVIAYFTLYRPESGHFVVLVPSGTTGKMAQVIDPPYSDRILDYDRIFDKRHQW